MTITRLLSLYLCGVLTLMAAHMCLADPKASITRYTQQLKTLQGDINQLQRDINRINTERDALRKTLQEAERAIGLITVSIDETEQKIKDEQSRLNALNQERATLLSNKAQQSQAIASTLLQAYKMGNQSHIKLLINQTDPTRITRLLSYHRYISQARANKIQQYLVTLTEIEAVETTILASQVALSKKSDALSQQRLSLDKEQASRKKTLASLNQNLADKQRSLSEQVNDRKRLQTLIDKAQAALAALPKPSNVKSFKAVRGTLKLPVSGKIVHRFGNKRANGKLKWKGLFIASREGSPVTSVHFGRVIFADYLKGYGLLVIIDHGNNYMSLYAHNQSVTKKPGDKVAAGTVIARAGNSGGNTQAGVYFEIRHKGQPLNPSPWFAP